MSWKTEALKNLGPVGFTNFLLRNRFRARSPFRLRSRQLRHPVWARPGTSDLAVFAQILAQHAYGCLEHVSDPSLIIDCGANAGYSTAYFLSRWPRADVVAIEADPENFAALERNVAPYGDRCRTMLAGVWPETCGLVVEGGDPGMEWARTVRPARPDERPMITGVDIASVAEGRPISILKIDIEGAEREIFSQPAPWLPLVENLAIELHGPEAEAAFHAAVKDEGYSITRSGELTVCSRTT